MLFHETLNQELKKKSKNRKIIHLLILIARSNFLWKNSIILSTFWMFRKLFVNVIIAYKLKQSKFLRNANLLSYFLLISMWFSKKKHNIQILLNNDIQINFIFRNLIQHFKFSFKFSKLMHVKIVNESILRTYKMHFLNFEIKSQFDIVRYFIDFFLKIDFFNKKFILNVIFLYNWQFWYKLRNMIIQITCKNRKLYVYYEQNIWFKF